MIKLYNINEKILTLKSDLAGEFPLYIYQSDDKQTLVYSDSITELLDNDQVIKPLKVSTKGISFLLQSGVVPPPYTAYENIFIVGIGDTAKVFTKDGKIEIEFSHEFPFKNENRVNADEMTPNTNEILDLVAKATIDRMDETKPTFLFHSAGKDSNTIALALARAGYQDKVTLITHKSKGDADESEISKSIAKQLGFKHQVLYEVDELQSEHKKAIDEYFINAPFPCIDGVTLAYPLYAVQMPELRGANIIDGMGNDVYIGHIPSKSEFKRQKLSKYLKHGRFLSRKFSSESLIHVSGRTRAEWTGLSGMSYFDIKSLVSDAYDVHDFWKTKDSNIDYLNFRADLRGCIIDTEIFIRKVRNFTDSINSNLILPFSNEIVAKYFAKMPEKYLFDRENLKNKLILRDILKKEIGLDSDAIGKMGFSYDSRSIVLQNWEMISEEIFVCDLWDKEGTKKLINRLRNSMDKKGWGAGASGRLIYRLYLVSSWINKNRWMNK